MSGGEAPNGASRGKRESSGGSQTCSGEGQKPRGTQEEREMNYDLSLIPVFVLQILLVLFARLDEVTSRSPDALYRTKYLSNLMRSRAVIG
jgi:hypothetical protein